MNSQVKRHIVSQRIAWCTEKHQKRCEHSSMCETKGETQECVFPAQTSITNIVDWLV